MKTNLNITTNTIDWAYRESDLPTRKLNEVRIAQDINAKNGVKSFTNLTWDVLYNLVQITFLKGKPLSLYEARYHDKSDVGLVDTPCAFYLDIDDKVSSYEEHNEEDYLRKVQEDLKSIGLLEPWKMFV